MDFLAIAPWFGSKRQLAPRIVEELGHHTGYCEPFCGSMAVLLSKPRSSSEIVNDLHRDLINLARVIASPRWGELADRAERTLMAREIYLEAHAIYAKPGPVAESVASVSDEHIDRAYWFLVESWQGRNGTSGELRRGKCFAQRWTANGGHGPTRWHGAVRALPFWAERLQAVTIERMDGFAVIEAIDDSKEWVIYCDPPYLKKTRSYTHDFEDLDHSRLAAACAGFKRARVVISYYDDPKLDELYPGWTKIICPTQKNMSNQGKRGRKSNTANGPPEVLLINGPSFTRAKKPASLFAEA